MKKLFTAAALLLTVVCNSQTKDVAKPQPSDSVYIKSLELILNKYKNYLYDKYTAKEMDMLINELVKYMNEAVISWNRKPQK